MTRKQSFVVFLSPGTFFDETSERPIESWDIKTACKLAREVTERHGAKPYGFQFVERIVSDDVSDGMGGTLKVQPKTVRTSGTHYINGRLMIAADIEGLPGDNRILLSNMRCNDWPIVCETTNGWRHMGVFGEADFVVSSAGDVLERGDDRAHVAYRASKKRPDDPMGKGQ